MASPNPKSPSYNLSKMSPKWIRNFFLHIKKVPKRIRPPNRGIRTRGSKKVPNPDGKQKIWTQSGWENKNLITVRMGKKKSNHSPDGTAFPKLESYLQSGWEKFSRGSRIAKSRTKLLFYFHFYILYFKIIWKNKE